MAVKSLLHFGLKDSDIRWHCVVLQYVPELLCNCYCATFNLRSLCTPRRVDTQRIMDAIARGMPCVTPHRPPTSQTKTATVSGAIFVNTQRHIFCTPTRKTRPARIPTRAWFLSRKNSYLVSAAQYKPSSKLSTTHSTRARKPCRFPYSMMSSAAHSCRAIPGAIGQNSTTKTQNHRI